MSIQVNGTRLTDSDLKVLSGRPTPLTNGETSTSSTPSRLIHTGLPSFYVTYNVIDVTTESLRERAPSRGAHNHVPSRTLCNRTEPYVLLRQSLRTKRELFQGTPDTILLRTETQSWVQVGHTRTRTGRTWEPPEPHGDVE